MPSAAILPASITIPRRSNQSLSSCRALTGADFPGPFSLSFSSFTAAGDLASAAIIRMGGGPRTFPGGVSKWQWKRMQAKKAKQLLKARLCRERQLYEMRKRAELKAAISELERPWEVVERAPVLFSVSADEQVKVLADRFQRPTGFDMWSERDGPQLFRSPDDLPSARFFPKGAVHSLKPYSAVAAEIADVGGGSAEGDEEMRYNDWIARGAGGIGRGRRVRKLLSDSSSPENVLSDPGKLGCEDTGESRASCSSDSELFVTESRKEENEMSDVINRPGQNHAPRVSDKEPVVTGLRIEDDDEIVGEFSPGNDRSLVSHLSDSEIVLAGTASRMEGHKRAGSFSRRVGLGGRGGFRDSYKSHSMLPVTGSMMDGNEMVRDFDRHSGRSSNRSSRGGSDSELVVAGSSTQGHKISNGFDRHGVRRGRGGRSGNQGSYRSNSAFSVTGSRLGRDERVGNFGRRGVHGHNRASHISNSQIRVRGSRMEQREMVGGFSRHDGRGGHGGYRSSSRSYSNLAVDDSRIDGHTVGNFGRYGNTGRSRNSHGFDSKRPVTGRRTEEDDIAGNFVGRGVRGGRSGRVGRGGRGSRVGNRDSYGTYSHPAITSSRVKGDVTAGRFGRGGRHGSFHGSYDSDSELSDLNLRKDREMFGVFGRPSGGRGYKNAGRSSLRPTTQLRLEEGGHRRRGPTWGEEEE